MPATLHSAWTPDPDDAERRIAFGAASHPGTVRTVNEDRWFTSPPVFLVADGMGGHQAGDVASSIVVSTFDEMVRDGVSGVASVAACIARCQERIGALGTDSASPGSTLVGAVYLTEDGAGYWLVVNIGDSRAYWLTEDGFEQLSKDHSVVQELIDAGRLSPSAAASHPERHVITRALGPFDNLPADYSWIPVIEDSTLLLCSDGVTSELRDGTIARLLESGMGAQETAEALITAAVNAGGRDNATAVVLQVRGSADPTHRQRRDDVASATDTLPGRRTP